MSGMSGIAKINPQEAMSKANNMKSIASNIEELLNKASRKLEEINDEDVGMYHGQRRPSELRAELDEYKQTFSRFHGQIDAYSDSIIAIAQKMLAE